MHERYRLVRPLATGGMAELFLGVARTEGFERTVAIKRVLPQLAQEPDIARMFLAEARLAMQLQHQNIATVYDVGHGPAGLFLVMELVDGWDLGVLLRTAARQGVRFPPHLAAFVVVQALAGLSHAYRKVHDGRPVMAAHRDVSPSNVLVSREGEVKVTDFGIARLEGSAFTEPGVFKGKEAYSAPEVLQGAPANALSDQFALGIVFYELLAGRHPFHDAKQPVAVTYAILSREVSPPPADVPAPLADAVLRMLARAPEQRFPTPELLGELLARWLSRAGEPATSHALSDFMRQLRLPPTLREAGEAGGAPKAEQGPATRPSHPGSFSLEEDPPHEHEPGGVALSASGRLVHRCARCDTPLSSVHAPCDACAEERSPPSTTFSSVPPAPALGGPSGPRASTSAGRSSPGVPHAPAGRARQGASNLAPSPPQTLVEASVPALAQRPMRSVLEVPGESLELAERAPRPKADWEEDTSTAPRRRKRAVMALGVVAMLAAGGGGLYSQRATLPGHLAKLGVPMASPRLSVISNPPGATVLVEGQDVGLTPLAMDNLYPGDKPLTVQVRLRGYRTWKGTFRGGEPVEFKVALDR